MASLENYIMEHARDTVLVLLKATPQVIARRMNENPHPRTVLKEKDIEHVLSRFEEEFASSTIRFRLTLDTSTATEQETLGQFVSDIQSHLSERDRTRLLAHRASQGYG
jgi:hypothetical protein